MLTNIGVELNLPYWNSAVTDAKIILGLIGVIWGFLEVHKSHEIII